MSSYPIAVLRGGRRALGCAPFTRLLTAYGLFFTKRWGRALALTLSAVYVWVFPVGTLLAVYTFWFLLGEGGKRFYDKPTGGDLTLPLESDNASHATPALHKNSLE